jgi:hypothetical protein
MADEQDSLKPEFIKDILEGKIKFGLEAEGWEFLTVGGSLWRILSEDQVRDNYLTGLSYGRYKDVKVVRRSIHLYDVYVKRHKMGEE